MNRKRFLLFFLAPFLGHKQEPQLHITKHPAFAELRVRYEWDDATNSFPRYLKSGRNNPLFGVGGFTAKLNP